MRPRVFYISYDGAAEPLGRTQVVAYLLRLAQTADITLFSFEKTPPSPELSAELDANGITWRPLRYHRRPPVLSTLIDVIAGRRALIRAARQSVPAIVHVRSYVPALIAVLARNRTGGRLLFDIRGFWADERVEGGLWRPGGFLYRVAKRCERRFFLEADAIVTLTDASVPQIREWADGAASVEVIPTCVDLKRFAGRPARPDGPHAVWSGSLSTWYRFDLVSRLAEAIGLPLTVVTREVEAARSVLAGYPAQVSSVPPADMPTQLFAGDVGLCLIAMTFSKTASAPTRFGEYLAVGMPVVVTPVGDLEALVEEHRVGVVLRGEDAEAISAAAHELAGLLADPAVGERCRRLARARFDVDLGSRRYAAIYATLAGPSPSA